MRRLVGVVLTMRIAYSTRGTPRSETAGLTVYRVPNPPQNERPKGARQSMAFIENRGLFQLPLPAEKAL